jgi:hypothetical protein
MAKKVPKRNKEMSSDIYSIYCLALAKYDQENIINVRAWFGVFNILLDAVEEKIPAKKRIAFCLQRLAKKLVGDESWLNKK